MTVTFKNYIGYIRRDIIIGIFHKVLLNFTMFSSSVEIYILTVESLFC